MSELLDSSNYNYAIANKFWLDPLGDNSIHSVQDNVPTINLMDKLKSDPNSLFGYTGPTDLTGGASSSMLNNNGGGLTNEWFDMKGKGGMALGGLQFGLGAFNSWMGLKNQKFMQDYYGKQQALQMTDFGNNAKMANLGLQNRQAAFLSNRGVNPDSENGQAQMADYMNKWKVKETI